VSGLDDGTELTTLRDAIQYLAKTVPKAEQDHENVLSASDHLTRSAEGGRKRWRPIFPLFVVIVVRPRPMVPVRPRPVVPVVAPLPVVPVVTSLPVVAILTTSGRVIALFKNRAAPSAELLSISP
jgi:hypothetical protein